MLSRSCNKKSNNILKVEIKYIIFYLLNYQSHINTMIRYIDIINPIII